MSGLQRVSVAVELAERIDIEAAVPVFQQWIRTGVVDGMLIDVARYKHVPNGPGVMLIGHDGDYSVEERGERVSLRYTLKRDTPPSAADAVELALGRLQLAAAAFRRDLGLGVRDDAVEVTISDRLRAPNTPEMRTELVPQVRAAVAAGTGRSAAVGGAVGDDPRDPMRMLVTLS